MKAILINPFDQTIKETEYTGDYREIYSLVDCRTFDCVRLTPHEDMYIDDEGLLIDNQRYFRMLEIGANYAGKALLLSHDDEGETKATNWTLQDVKDMVEWLPETHRETPYMEFTAWK
jgi:hypothetical protein